MFIQKEAIFKLFKKKTILFSVQNLNIKIASSPNDHFYFNFFKKNNSF